MQQEDLARATLLAANGGGAIGLQQRGHAGELAARGDEELRVVGAADLKVEHFTTIATGSESEIGS